MRTREKDGRRAGEKEGRRKGRHEGRMAEGGKGGGR